MKITIRSLIIAVVIILIIGNGTIFADEKYDIKIYVGETIDLDTFLIDNLTISSDEDTEWSSGNESIIRVTSQGVVEGLKEGKSTVYVKSNAESSRVATIKIQVISMIDYFELADDDTVRIQIGEIYNLDYLITPVDGNDSVYNDEIEWFSSRESIVEVDDNGQLTGIGEGTAKISAVTDDGNIKDTVIVEVSGIKEDILIDNGLEEIDIYVGESHQFAVLNNTNVLNSALEWTASTNDYLELDDNGEITGKEEGRTQIKAATKDKKKFDTIIVNVISMIDSIELNRSIITFEEIGEQFDLEYTIIPAFEGVEPFEKDVTWSSSNSSIVSVNSDGLITAKKGGTVRIAVTTKDGDHLAACSVSVPKESDEKKVFVTEIKLDNPKKNILIGEKYALPIELYPVEATELKLHFGTDNGSSSQVKEEDGVYYFTPTISGDNIITIRSESDVEYEYEIEVLSPIKGVEIPTDNLIKVKNDYIFYVGQRMPLTPIFELEDGYNKKDILVKDVTWKTTDTSVLGIEVLERFDGEYHTIVGVSSGRILLGVVTDDGDYFDTINIKMLSPYSSIKLIDDVTLPIMAEFIPDAIVEIKEDILYELQEEDLELFKETEILRQYVKTSTIEDEITLEKEIIVDLQKSAINSINASIIYKEINEHKSRLSKLELIYKTSKNGYCELLKNVELEDQFGDNYVIAEVDDNVVTGIRDGKVELSVTFEGTKVVEVGTYYFSSDLKGIIVVNSSGEIINMNESGFSNVFTEEALQEKIKLATLIEERYGRRSSEDIPADEYIKEILELESLGIVPDSLKSDYKDPVTRLELSDTFINLIEYISDEDLKRPTSSRFTDTSSLSAELAYNLGLLDVTILTDFDPSGYVTPVTLSKAIDKMRLALTAYGYEQDKLILDNDLNSGQKIFLDIEKVSPSHRKYIEKYATEYGIIEGKASKLYPDEGLTREVFLYYVWKLVN